MNNEHAVRTLHPLEIRVLLSYLPGDGIDSSMLKRDLGFRDGQDNQAFSWLVARGLLAETARRTRSFYEITALGRQAAQEGIPERRIFDLLVSRGPLGIPDAGRELGLDQKSAGSACGQLIRDGSLRLDADKRVVPVQGKPFPDRLLLVEELLTRAVAAAGIVEETDLSESQKTAMAGVSRKRGAGDAFFRIAEREHIVYSLLPGAAEVRSTLEALGITGEELGAVTREMLDSGTWKTAAFRPYSIGVSAPRSIPGRRNPYVEFLESVKDKLVSLGFEEFDGGLVETEFWNSDALFMPQFHSARDIHDVYHLAAPSRASFIEEPYLSNVADTHEFGGRTGSRGWSYDFDREFTRRLILRSQGTVLSARQLPVATIPGKYFGIVRCFRYDRVDATHLSDFYQTEGIVLGETANLRTLLGFLEMFAVEVAGAKEVKYVPGYFPFTEPSVEIHIKHPVLGWFELGGAGIFRPEVTEPLGVSVPVLAWGIGIDRMALMALGLNDLRELFSPDLESIRLRRSTARIG